MMDDPVYLAIVAVVVLIAVAALMYEKGWLGGKPRLVSMIESSEANLAKLRGRLEAKIEQERMKEAAKQAELSGHVAGGAGGEGGAVTSLKDKATRITENKKLLDAGVITQEEYDVAKAKILTE